MKKHLFLLVFLFAFLPFSSRAQTYIFDTLYSPASCLYTYELAITIRLDSVMVTQIYSDDSVSSGSFAFEAYVSYENVFTNSTLPPGNFYTYEISVYSDNPNLSTPVLTNNISNVPLTTGSAGGFASSNNPTYNGSAYALGLTLNQAYSDPGILLQLGYDSATIRTNTPCQDTTTSNSDYVPPTPTPVSLLPLKAIVSFQTVTLSWGTTTELNNAGFTIERSVDSKHWQKLSFQKSKAAGGKSQELISYDYAILETEDPVVYYRLIQHDFDGKATLSNIAKAVLRQHRQEVSVFPNPATGIIRVQALRDGDSYKIFDAYGRCVQEGRYSQSGLNISSLAQGMHLIKTPSGTCRFIAGAR